MNLNVNYYKILEISYDTTINDIKKAYYKLSFKHHPDHGGNKESFSIINEAYVCLTESRDEYDKKSKYGKYYNESEELFKVDFENFDYNTVKSNYKNFKNNEMLDIIIEVDKEKFDGSLDFNRYIICKECRGTGKDTTTKISFKNQLGEVRYFDADDGCDLCEGTGKDIKNNICNFCKGLGKIGINNCKKCEGKRRLLGKQRLKNIELIGDTTIIKAMGNMSQYHVGMVGNLIIKLK